MSPTKQHYQRLYRDDCNQLLVFTESAAFQRAVIHVKAMMMDERLPSEHIQGAVEFLKRLNDLAQPETPMGTMPDKSLKTNEEIMADLREQEEKQKGAS